MANFSDPTQTYQTGFDPNTGLFFYLNNITGETSWDEPEALRLPEGYQRGFDENTGRVYYGNVLTGEVSWEFPVFQQPLNVWEVNVDSEGRTFYFNTVTQQSQWDPPPELAQQYSQPLALSSLQTLAGLYPVALAVRPLVQDQKADVDAVAGVQEPQAHRDHEIRRLYSMITKTQLTGK